MIIKLTAIKDLVEHLTSSDPEAILYVGTSPVPSPLAATAAGATASVLRGTHPPWSLEKAGKKIKYSLSIY